MKPFIQEDIRKLSEELTETQTLLNKMDENERNSMIAIRDLDEIKERLLSFEKYAEEALPEVLIILIQNVIEKIYIVDKNCERYLPHLYQRLLWGGLYILLPGNQLHRNRCNSS